MTHYVIPRILRYSLQIKNAFETCDKNNPIMFEDKLTIAVPVVWLYLLFTNHLIKITCTTVNTEHRSSSDEPHNYNHFRLQPQQNVRNSRLNERIIASNNSRQVN